MGRWLPGGRNRPKGLSLIVDDDDLALYCTLKVRYIAQYVKHKQPSIWLDNLK